MYIKTQFSLTLALLVLSVCHASAQVPSYIQKNGLVVCYSFDNTLEDIGPLGYDALPAQAFIPGYTKDRFNRDLGAIKLDSQSLVVLDAPELRLKKGSLGCWFNTSEARYQWLIHKTKLAAAPQEVANENYQLVINVDDGAAGVALRGASKYDSECKFGQGWIVTDLNDPNKALNNGQWHHAVYTWDESEAILWLDGVIVERTAMNGKLGDDCAGSDLHFGRDWNEGSPLYSGNMDEIALWNVKLTEEDVVRWYKGTNDCVPQYASDSILGYRNVETHQVVTYALRNDPALSYKWIATGGYMLGASTNHFCDVIWGYDKNGSVCCIVSDSTCSDTVCVTTTINNKTTGGIAGGDVDVPTMSVKPNPAADMIDISTALGDKHAHFELVDVTGVVVQRVQGIHTRMSVSDVAPGVYHIVQRDALGNVLGMERVVIKR